MELPADEEHDEQVVRVPEPLKVSTAALLHSIPDHDGQSSSHDPASGTGTSREVRCEECHDTLAGSLRVRVSHSQLGEIDHVGGDVHDRADNDRPGGRLMEGDVLVEGDDIVKGGAAEEGNEVAADGEEDECDVDVEDQRGGTRND